MELPDWAVRALEQFRPTFSHRSDTPDPDRLRQWGGLDSRFRKRWAELETEKWKVPDNHPRYANLRANHKYPPGEYVRQCILECAIESAWELGVGQDPEMTIRAVKTLDSLNDRISVAAADLAVLFRRRQAFLTTYSLSDQQQSIAERFPDPFRIFGAFELALTRPEFQSWAYVAKSEIKTFLTSAATQSRPVPTWAALLDEAANRMPRVVTSVDPGNTAVFGSKSNKSKWSPWALRLIARLDDWAGDGLPNGFFLACLTHQQLATLAEVATNAPENAYSASQMKELIKRYRKRQQTQERFD